METIFDHGFIPPPPLRAFVYGVILGEIYQWGSWKSKHPDQPLFGYWKVGLPHLMTNLFIVVGVAALWKEELLDKALAMIPGTGDWANTGVPFTPPIGLLLGIGSDIGGDSLAYLLRKVIGSRLPFTQQQEPPPSPPPLRSTGGDS